MALNSLTILLLLAATCISYVDLQQIQWRLPTIVRPTRYRLNIIVTQAALSEESDEYGGTVTIHFFTEQSTNRIQLHSSYDFINITLVTVNNNFINAANYSVDNVTDILTITLPNNIVPNFPYQLIIGFTGLLSTRELTGFYKSSYVTGDGETRYLAATQFQPTSARRAFPCFDEPFFKAIFEISITYPLGYNALSNTPGNPGTDAGVLATTHFNDTAVMSTYLIAFVISNFTCTQGEFIGSVPYQVCSREETNDTRDWALRIGPPLVQSLNDYTQFDYNRSKAKLDQVAIPDFDAGAMENWGLVTYRELLLLWDPAESSNSQMQRIATINSHEFGHFWFGNLVTCNWWSETFLNEGFATYFEYFTTHDVFPSWELDKQFIIDIVEPILVNDALENPLPLQSEANSPSEVNAKFAAISYFKGAAVFRMVEHIMGSNNFRTGLINYLNEYQYQTTLPEDLWQVLDEAINNNTSQLPANLTNVMHNWVNNPGFPLLEVRVQGARITITQERFLISGQNTTSKWYVPITYTTSEDANKFQNTTPRVWLTPTADASFNIEPTNATWFILNNQQTGYFRVNYDANAWNNIKRALQRPNFDGIIEENRAHIVDDLFNLARSDRIPYAQVFEIVEFLTNDTSYFSWVPAIRGFNFVLNRVGLETQLGKALSSFILELMENLYSSVSFIRHNVDDQIYTLKQVLTFNTACRLGHSACLASTKIIFDIYKNFRLIPARNLRGLVYCNALRQSIDQRNWEFLWEVYQNTTLASEQATIISALGCTRDTELLEKYLNFTITENSGIRSQDRHAVFNSVINGNPSGVNVAFDFLIRNHHLINEMYITLNALPNLINNIAGAFTEEEQLERLKEFIETGGFPEQYIPSATIALEAARANIEWTEHFFQHLFDFFFAPPTPDDATRNLGFHTGVAVLLVYIWRLF